MKQLVGEFQDRRVPCRVRGCKRSWTWHAGEQSRAARQGGGEPPQRMCEACHSIFTSLADREEPCSTKGCAGKWTWKRGAQLEASLKGTFERPPRRMCPACEEKLKSAEDVEKPCRIRGCKNTWTLTALMQVRAGIKDGMCASCRARFEKVTDQTQPCRVAGCPGTWVWTRWSQVEQAARQSVAEGDEPKAPERLCDGCNDLCKSLEDMPQPCRLPGCANTWVWTRQMQIRAWAEAGGGQNAAPPAPPERMCDECNRNFSGVEDREVPCRLRGCKRTWVFTRGAQFERILRGEEERVPARLCDDCQKLLAVLEPFDLPCTNAGCTGTWSCPPDLQLAAIRESEERGREPQAPQRQCADCERFLREHSAIDVTCESCGASVHWPAHAQLRVQLGAWSKPSRCANCATQV